MITLNDRFSLKRDPYNWILIETYEGKDKARNPKLHTKETYHQWPDQALRYAAELQGIEDFQDLIRAYEDAVQLIRDEGVVSRELCSEMATLRSQALRQQRLIKLLGKKIKRQEKTIQSLRWELDSLKEEAVA